MLLDSDEAYQLRGVLRDLVALSALPAAWIGREPPAVATGLAEALIGLLQLDFAFVRLRDPGGAGAVDVTRGDAWQRFPDWLDGRLSAGVQLSGKELVPDVGSDAKPRRGVVVPIGVNAEEGVVAAACERPEFPTEIDQLLLSLAANHAATAFRSARLVHERSEAEHELREARNELGVKVAEQTAELRRSEAYLAEAQRLTQTGSFAINASTGEAIHWSDEHCRLFGFDPRQGPPSAEAVLQRIHPEDRVRCLEAFERAVRDVTGDEIEFRVLLPDGRLRYIRSIGHLVATASDEPLELVGTAIDVTERKRAEEDRQAQLWFFESMDGINRAIQSTSDLEEMMGAVLDVVLGIFDCDRAWLIYPCAPDAASHEVRMERTRPDSIGAFGLGVEIPNDPEVAAVFRTALASGGPARFDPESGHALPSAPAERFTIRSMIAMAVHPKIDEPYLFGLHQVSHARVWTPQEERLFQEIGRRLADALDTLLMLRNVRESERELEASRAELAVSRARIVTAADETRRRIERDLHDGVQQRLVSVALELGVMEAALPPDDQRRAELAHTARGLTGALEDLVEISRGIHPAILAQGGLTPALRTLVRRSAVPVELEVRTETRLPAPVEVAAYYVVSEALTNTAKHAHASTVDVAVEARDGVLELSIRDDGSGGADPTRGSGLIGLTDRVHVLGGTLEVASPAGGGTTLLVTLPIEDGSARVDRDHLESGGPKG